MPGLSPFSAALLIAIAGTPSLALAAGGAARDEAPGSRRPSQRLAQLPPALPALPELPPLPTGPATPTARQPQGEATPARLGLPAREGERLLINGRAQRARWRWLGAAGGPPQQLWLPLEVLQNQLGVSSRSLSDGSLDLEWFGAGLQVPGSAQQSLDDEVALDALPLLQALGVTLQQRGQELELRLPGSRLLQVRSSQQGRLRRLVLDLSGAAVVRQEGSALAVDIRASAAQRQQLAELGLNSREAAAGDLLLQSRGQPAQRVFTLGSPARLVIELPVEGRAPAAASQPPIDARVRALLGQGLRWERLQRGDVRINAVRIDPRSGPLQLKPLAGAQGMEGLQSLPQLAQINGALVAINGGYFNRVRQLPLGALKRDGQWLSGPILNRGVAAWNGRELPRFGRLRLEEWVQASGGPRLPVVALNSGYVQRGISRYDRAWGPAYRALSGQESAVLVRGGQVVQQLGTADLERGVPLSAGDLLLVGRGGVTLPWPLGSAVQLSSRSSSALGAAQQVVGGGPLLLLDGRIVLNGAAETFSAAFLRQGAPRTVLASDGREIWLITLEGLQNAGPTLGEAAQLLLQLGLRDALNLDGGSSTGLVLGGSQQVMGRGVAGRVHNGVGLTP